MPIIPLFVWIAVALAVLLIGGGTAIGTSKLPEAVAPIAEKADSLFAPLGIGLAIGFIIMVLWVLFVRLKRPQP